MITQISAKITQIQITCILFSILLLLVPNTNSYPAEIAIIVNKANPNEGLTFEEVMKIFKQEKQYWPDGKRIYLVVRESGSQEKIEVLEKIYKMTDMELKRFWLTKLYQGKISSFPKVLNSNLSMKRFIASLPNAIGFIDVAEVDETIKVLKIDDKLPDEENYPL